MRSPFEKIRKVPAYRVLAEAISERILDGRLREGEQLPTEAQLCEMFGVNRSTVREGIRVLEEGNLLRRENAKRMVISRPTDREVGMQVERALILNETSFGELWEAMSTIEPTMATLAAQRGEPALLAELEANLARTKAAVAEGRSVVELDIEFHGLVAAMCGNRALMMAHEPLGRLFYPSFEAVITGVPGADRRLLDAHREILDAIRAGDAETAGTWMRKHIDDFQRGARLANLDTSLPAGRELSSRAAAGR